ncbi:MAG TPA: hypothetical protein VF529_08580 [Solirubrobacteraceae bacterium]
MRRLPPILLALVLGVLSAVAVSCGDDGDDKKLLAPSRASEIKDELDKIDERVTKGECDELAPAFTRLERAINGLPRSTDRRLRRRLVDGVANLQRIAPEQCRDNRPETTDTTETAPETTTTPPETETTPPPTETTPPPTETTPPPTTDVPTPPETTAPDDTGGQVAPEQNFVPPGQARKGSKEE